MKCPGILNIPEDFLGICFLFEKESSFRSLSQTVTHDGEMANALKLHLYIYT